MVKGFSFGVKKKKKRKTRAEKKKFENKVVKDVKKKVEVIWKVKNKMPHLETDVDRLLNLIKEKGEISISEAAKKFGVEEGKIEEWGKILEEHKLIKMHYPPIGNPLLKIYGNKD